MAKAEIDFDMYGHCVNCHETMLEERLVDGEMKKMLTGAYQETEYLLNDGSTMRVAICKKCKRDLKDDDAEKELIMTCVFKGWQHEIEAYSKWKPKRKKDYLDRYKLKKIVTRSEGLGKDVLSKKLKKYKGRKKVKV